MAKGRFVFWRHLDETNFSEVSMMRLNTTRIRCNLAAAFLAGSCLLAGCGGPQGPTHAAVHGRRPARAIAATGGAGRHQPGRRAVRVDVEIVAGRRGVPEAAGAVSLAARRSPSGPAWRQPVAVKLNAYSTDQNFTVLRTGYVFAPTARTHFAPAWMWPRNG
jgi:hypothetical protein